MLQIPTLRELYEGIVSDIEAQLEVTISTTQKSFVRAIAMVQAGKLKLAYLLIGKTQKNIAPDTAESESQGGTLERFGRIKLGRNPFSATAGQYEVEVTGEIGATIPAGQIFKSDDTSLNPGNLYILDEEFELTATTDSIILRALTTGSAGELNDGDTLTATSPIALVDSAATVVDESVTPLDAETIEEYRQKVLDSYRLEPQGGAAADYRLWAADAQGVAQSYPYAKTGYPGEVIVYVEANISDSEDGKGTPGTTILEEVEEVIELNPDETLTVYERARRPITAVVDVQPVTPLDVTIEVVGYSNLTAAIETTITDELETMISLVRPFVSGIDILSERNDILSYNTIVARILQAKPGAVFTSIILTVDGNTVDTFTFTDGFIPYLDSVTFS